MKALRHLEVKLTEKQRIDPLVKLDLDFFESDFMERNLTFQKLYQLKVSIYCDVWAGDRSEDKNKAFKIAEQALIAELYKGLQDELIQLCAVAYNGTREEIISRINSIISDFLDRRFTPK